jgi:hypothetical protein
MIGVQTGLSPFPDFRNSGGFRCFRRLANGLVRSQDALGNGEFLTTPGSVRRREGKVAGRDRRLEIGIAKRGERCPSRAGLRVTLSIGIKIGRWDQ